MKKNILFTFTLAAGLGMSFLGSASKAEIQKTGDFFEKTYGFNEKNTKNRENIEISEIRQNDTIYPARLENARIKIYPNPVQENFLFINLETEKEANFSARIYNMIGRVVDSKNLAKGENSFDLRGLKEGIYFVYIMENGQTIHSMKIVRQ